MAKNTAPLVIYFDRRKVDVYIGDQDKTVSWQMPSTIFHHLEIQDGRAFRKLFEDVIFANKIKPTKIIVIFSQNIVFAIDLPDGATEPEKREKLLAQFKEQVPFASPFVKEVKLEKKDMAIALNRDVFELMVTQLKGLGFDVTTLVTSHIVPFEIPATGMTSALAQNCIKEWPKLELYDFLEPEQKKSIIISREDQDPKDRNRIFIYLGLFAVMILIFGGVLLGYMQQNAQDKAAAEAARAQLQKQLEADQQVVPIAIPTQSSSPNTLEEVASLIKTSATPEQLAERQEYSIQIVSARGSQYSSEDVLDLFVAAGFSRPSVLNNATVRTSSIEVATDTDVAAATRLELRKLFSLLDETTLVKTVAEADANIVITLP